MLKELISSYNAGHRLVGLLCHVLWRVDDMQHNSKHNQIDKSGLKNSYANETFGEVKEFQLKIING